MIYIRNSRAFLASMIVCVVGAMITGADAAEPATKPTDTSPAVFRLKQAAMIPNCTIYAYQTRISGIDQTTCNVIVNAFERCRDADTAIIAEAIKHPEKEAELLGRIKAEQAKLTDAAKKSGFSPQKYAQQMAHAERIAGFESACMVTAPLDYTLLKAKDPMPGLIASLNLRAEQRKSLDRIRAEAHARTRAIWRDEEAVRKASQAGNGGDFNSTLWQAEIKATGVRAAEKFRAILTGDQLAIWKQELDRIAPH